MTATFYDLAEIAILHVQIRQALAIVNELTPTIEFHVHSPWPVRRGIFLGEIRVASH